MDRNWWTRVVIIAAVAIGSAWYLIPTYYSLFVVDRKDRNNFAVLDARHYLRRPVARFFRGALGLNDEAEALAMRSRFMEIWSASYPAVSSTTAGL